MSKKKNWTCTRRIQFCSGHRVLNHESKCANPHGHNYVALFTAQAEKLDSIGRVVDFSVLKEKMGGWIDRNWDHTFLVYDEDLSMVQALNMSKGNNKPPYYCMFNPTAENMADHLLREVAPRIMDGTGVKITKVVLWETENCYAEATLD